MSRTEFSSEPGREPLLDVRDLKVMLPTGDRSEVLEGPEAEAVSIIAFASYEEAKAWYECDEYRAAMARRLQGTDFRLLLVDGADAVLPPGQLITSEE